MDGPVFLIATPIWGCTPCRYPGTVYSENQDALPILSFAAYCMAAHSLGGLAQNSLFGRAGPLTNIQRIYSLFSGKAKLFTQSAMAL